ncbi:TIGR03885 family FMN-dependent LLM class oxidoreductase [Agrobacterium vitis]|uniref:TIGR03885 family FMN-dependent LLM class oxidoreductase n=1 Tax=Agrobacterium vitis TaxID=373 RepID=UPI001571DDAB|nr:TIGR03885 family FMN-dependent LLM class oxidoreductase [Agrobacterium vitis]NSY14958.1 TIGR03885 family FMN-dependent LLM class oxidoreductase [Agrobacterium vitis]NSY24715.1 TIGR03885 family FMN-dependent LLM class oxidoreductase [Agrobacterium vitis]WEO75336.1 TIGR03885 family FMN-dependent LLM class oxidoreductase [Agrobacterium vitis]
MLIGYHASHEQFSPSQLLDYVQAAERAGFQAIMTSDHLAPWSHRQGNSGNNWAWLGAAMAKTRLPFGSLAIPGGWRYHPVVLAHLVATLSEMFPERLRWIAMGSGEALNENAVGRGWPDKTERNERLEAGSEIIRALLAGETVTSDHPHLKTEQAKLWSLPNKPPLLLGAALTEETASWLGKWADGLVTVRKPANELKRVVEAFRSSGGAGRPLALQLQVSWAPTFDEARMAAWHEWRNAAVTPDLLAELKTPAEFDAASSDVTPEGMDEFIPLITRGDELLDLVEECVSCGFDEIYVHNVSRNQHGFIDFMAEQFFSKPNLRRN